MKKLVFLTLVSVFSLTVQAQQYCSIYKERPSALAECCKAHPADPTCPKKEQTNVCFKLKENPKVLKECCSTHPNDVSCNVREENHNSSMENAKAKKSYK